MAVRLNGNLEQWVRFFLLVIHESAEDAIQTIAALVTLHEKNWATLENTGKSALTMQKVFRYLESNPIINIQKTSFELELSYNAVSRAVKRLVELGILVQTERRQRNRVFAYEAYLELLRKDT